MKHNLRNQLDTHEIQGLNEIDTLLQIYAYVLKPKALAPAPN